VHADGECAAPSLSLEKTRTVIEQCITAYLQETASNRMKSAINTSSRDQAMNSKPSSGLELRSTRRPSHGSHQRSPTGDLDISSLGLSNDHTDLPSTTSLSKTNTNDTMEEDKRLSGRYIFRQLENYLIACMNDCDCLNNAFITSLRPHMLGRTASEASVFADRSRKPDSLPAPNEDPLFEVDAKTLLLGDIGENGTWWTGNRRPSNKKARDPEPAQASTERKSLRLDLPTIYQWYDAILSCGRNWRNYRRLLPTESRQLLETPELDHQLEDRFVEGRYHAQRTLLKTMENLLRRPGRPIRESDECRFLIILLLNPQLFPQHGRLMTPTHELRDPLATRPRRKPSASQGSATGHHSGIIKRALGLMSNTSSDCHQAIVSWTCRLNESHFRDLVELVNGFVSYRLGRQHRGRSDSNDPTAGLVPSMTGLGAGTSAHLHAALGVHRQTSNKEPKDKIVVYGNDWQIRAAAKVMSLLFSANNHPKFPKFEYPRYVADPTPAAARQRAHRHAQLLPTSAFYNSLLDTADLITDFETWESRSSKFCFCQYPMFLSIWAKIRIMEHDARRQMEVKARDAFFTSIMSRKAVNQYLVLKVRRDCLVDDSLRSVSEVVGTGQEEIKKGLRIEFTGEEGVDAGG
jgi:E3 ubiquitin-protein ligase HECTD2